LEGTVKDLLTIMLVDPDDTMKDVVENHIDEISEVELVSAVKNIQECYDNLSVSLPDIIFIDLHRNGDHARIFETAGKISIEYPDIAIFVSSDIQEPQLILTALRSGAQEFFTKPLKFDEFSTAVGKITYKKKRAVSASAPKNKLITVFSKKGGQGVTTLSVNLAGAYAKIFNEKAAIFDLDLQLGDVTSFLDLTPQYSIVDTCGIDGEIDSTKLQSCMTHHNLGISILAEPPDPAESDLITATQIGQIISHLKSMFSHVIVDTTHRFDSRTLEVFAQSDHILLVTVASIPAIRATRKSLDILKDLGYGKDKVKVVVNRTSKRDQINIKEIEKNLEYPVYWSIPNNYKAVIKAIDSGIPLVAKKHMPNVGKSIFELAKFMMNGDYSHKFKK
jgi:pilus assembly protein CpaE